MKSALFVLVCLAVCWGSNADGLKDLPWKLGKCNQIPQTPGFNAQKFFSGKWYVAQSLGDVFFQKTGKCLSTANKISKDGQAETLFYTYFPWVDQYASVLGHANLLDVQHKGTFFDTTYKLGLIDMGMPTSIVATDHTSWAFMYFCKQHLFYKSESAWALTRNRTQDFNANWTEAAFEAGLDLSTFAVVDNTDCRSGEPNV